MQLSTIFQGTFETLAETLSPAAGNLTVTGLATTAVSELWNSETRSMLGGRRPISALAIFTWPDAP